MECRENNIVYIVDHYCEIFENLEQAFEYCKEKFNEHNYCIKYNIEWDFNHDEYKIYLFSEYEDCLDYKIKKKII